jgi:hypothetical protein
MLSRIKLETLGIFFQHLLYITPEIECEARKSVPRLRRLDFGVCAHVRCIEHMRVRLERSRRVVSLFAPNVEAAVVKPNWIFNA